MKIPFYQVDAFADSLFAGNPAAVCLLEEWPATEVLQQVATENNLSETAFVMPAKRGKWAIRWFTPKVEVDLCGHATLAAAHVLLRERDLAADKLVFTSPSGDLKISCLDDMSLRMDFPVVATRGAKVSPTLLEGLGGYPSEVRRADDCLCIFDYEEIVRELQPDFRLLSRLPFRGIIVTAPSSNGQADFVSRFFAPSVGIDEDPVTGSAHCILAPYWAKRLGKERLEAKQVSERGGKLACELRGDRVLIEGKAITYLRGEVEMA
ncbi:MAG: isomerase [Opitutae bacterium]|jgi:predicted PhzF superfamily epimerase YddE/YHI9|nr:isomerase [Opitutae bacterium]|tara:strand:+ start:6453 stop:7247 length:795 start_codon:yes stop_codon:yes gene_type:complete